MGISELQSSYFFWFGFLWELWDSHRAPQSSSFQWSIRTDTWRAAGRRGPAEQEARRQIKEQDASLYLLASGIVAFCLRTSLQEWADSLRPRSGEPGQAAVIQAHHTRRAAPACCLA